jgi:hypothetical protein
MLLPSFYENKSKTHSQKSKSFKVCHKQKVMLLMSNFVIESQATANNFASIMPYVK